MNSNRRGSRAQPPTQASDEPLAPGPFEELFLKPTRPLDLDEGSDRARDVFPQAPTAATTPAEVERESIIYSPFTPATALPPAFPQPAEPSPVATETGAFKPAPPSFEKLVEELVPPPEDQESSPVVRRPRVPLALPAATALLILVIGAAVLLRERFTALLSPAPTPPVVAHGYQPEDALPPPSDYRGEAPSDMPPANPVEARPEAWVPEPASEPRSPSQADPSAAIPDTATTPAPPLPLAGALTAVSWQTSSAGTEVMIRGDGTFAPGRVRVNALAGPPRVLVRLAEVRPGAAAQTAAVGTREVERIRIGYHAELHPPELYVVLDLTSQAVALTGHTVEGDTVRVTLHRSR
jgi:hypothetical protein